MMSYALSIQKLNDRIARLELTANEVAEKYKDVETRLLHQLAITDTQKVPSWDMFTVAIIVLLAGSGYTASLS
ncbi:hypothetical protein Pmar_PMAR005109 [Perkinsus marinus ATCC 50983]|uniref:Uncharacterized protein n=1 Tax=Perkinsus marinus (strain ATCC 50983 / TXsc) TaxID=423536 RepID=C5KAM8_PERM5|nr:hypothetical protein Pmar_PMAR005109 [Perkinsus marinus ATCC 50983]EER18204.1 hypothetical protein Pmar_PMAR005109 [Perkinsus marinus ATCC 50983]|eukprot:XP_002786408.1 hypothetical protein Pmar_PMAR005109 [Perkinsus marinus ATCC 50983]